MARGRNQPPSTSNKTSVKTKTNAAGEKEHHDNSSSEEITMPRASRTTRRSLTIAKEQNSKEKGKKETEPNATISSPILNRSRLRSRSRKNVQSPADSRNLSLNLDYSSVATENIELTLVDTAEGTSTRPDEIFPDINNVANVVEIGDFSQISNTLTESSDCEDKQTVTIADKLTSFEGRNFAMSSTDEDSQSQSDCVPVQQDESSSNQEGNLTVTETTDSVEPDDEILLEVSTDQSVKINPSIYAFTSPPQDNKQSEESTGESICDVLQKDSPTPLCNIKSCLRNRDTPTPDRVVSSPEILLVHTNAKAPRTYQNRRKSKAMFTNDQKPMHATVNSSTLPRITESQDKSNIIQKKSFAQHDTLSSVIECRRSQRNRIIKYDVRDLLNKNRKSKIQIESKVVMKPKPLDSSPTSSIKRKSYEGYDTDRSSLLDSPQVFKGFSDSDNSKTSPITIREKMCTAESSLWQNSAKQVQKREVSIQTGDGTDQRKEIEIELTVKNTEKLDKLINIITKDEKQSKGAKKTLNESKVTDNTLSQGRELSVSPRKPIQESQNKSNSIIEEIIVLDDVKEQFKSNTKSRANVLSAPARNLRNKQVTESPIILSNDDITDEDDILPPPPQNIKKPTRTQEIFAKCLKRSQRVESLIERNILTQPKRKDSVNLHKNKISPKLNSSRSVADFEHFVEQVINLADDSSSGDSSASSKEITGRTVRHTRSKGKQPLNFENICTAPSAVKVNEKNIERECESLAAKSTTSKMRLNTETDRNKSNKESDYAEILFQVKVQDEASELRRGISSKSQISTTAQPKEIEDGISFLTQFASGKTRLSQKKTKQDSTTVNEDVKGDKTSEIMVLASSGDIQTISLNAPSINTYSKTRSSQKKVMLISETTDKGDINKKVKGRITSKSEGKQNENLHKSFSTDDLKGQESQKKDKEDASFQTEEKTDGDKTSKDVKTPLDTQTNEKPIVLNIGKSKEIDNIRDEKKIPLKKRSTQRIIDRGEKSKPEIDSNASDNDKFPGSNKLLSGEEKSGEVNLENMNSPKGKQVVRIRASLRKSDHLHEESSKIISKTDECKQSDASLTGKGIEEENKNGNDSRQETNIFEVQTRIHTRSANKNLAELNEEETDSGTEIPKKLLTEEQEFQDNEGKKTALLEQKSLNFEEESIEIVEKELSSGLDKSTKSLSASDTATEEENALAVVSCERKNSIDCDNGSNQSGSVIILDDDVSSKIDSSDSDKADDDEIESVRNLNVVMKKREKTIDAASDSIEIESEDEIPLNRRMKKTSWRCKSTYNNERRKSDEECNVSEAIMEIIVGEYSNKSKISEQSDNFIEIEMKNLKESEQIESIDLTISDLLENKTSAENQDKISEEENLKCNIIPEEMDQSENTGDSSQISSQIPCHSTTSSENVEDKTEEISPSKTDLKEAEVSKITIFSKTADLINNDDSKEIVSQKTPEKKRLGNRRILRSNKKENQNVIDLIEPVKATVEPSCAKDGDEIPVLVNVVSTVDVHDSNQIPDNQNETILHDKTSSENDITEASVDKEEEKFIAVTSEPKVAEKSGKFDCEESTNKDIQELIATDTNPKQIQEIIENKNELVVERGATDSKISSKEVLSNSAITQTKIAVKQQKFSDSKQLEQTKEETLKSPASIMEVKSKVPNLVCSRKSSCSPENKKDAALIVQSQEVGKISVDSKEIEIDMSTEKNRTKITEDAISTPKGADVEKEKKTKRTPPKAELISRKTDKSRNMEEFEKVSSKEEKERILHTLYCPQKAAVKETAKNVSTKDEKASEVIERDKKFSKQSSQKIESFSKSEKWKSFTVVKGEERKSSTKDKIEEKRSLEGARDLLNRSKPSKDSKLREDNHFNRSKSSNISDRKERFKDSARPYKSHNNQDLLRDDSSSSHYSKTDKYQKFKDVPRKNDDDRRDKKRKSDLTSSGEKSSSKLLQKNYESNVYDRKKSGKDFTSDAKSKSAKTYEESKYKERSSVKFNRDSTLEKQNSDTIIATKSDNNTTKLKSSNIDRKSAIKTSEQGKPDEHSSTFESDEKPEIVAIKDNKVNDPKLETPKGTSDEDNSNTTVRNVCEDVKTRESENSKPKLEAAQLKEKEKKRSRWDDPKLPEDYENKQKRFKLDIDKKDVQKCEAEIKKENVQLIEKNEEEKQKNLGSTKSENDTTKPSDIDDPVSKSISPLLSKAALKSYPIDFNLSSSSSTIANTDHYDVDQISQPTDLNENLELEIDKENKPIIATENLNQVQSEEIPLNDQGEVKKREKPPSPKDDSQDSQEDSNNSNIRRSHRLKTISKTKQSVGRGLVRDKERFIDSDDRTQSFSSSAELEAENAKFLKDMEDRLSQFQIIKENEYKCERVISKEAKKMICDCFLTREEEDRGELGCGEDCLNRLLMIECGPRCVVGDRCTNIRFTKNLYAPCKVFRTEKKGFGIMADGEILPGEFIMEYVGEVLDDKQFMKRAEIYSQDKNKHYYFMALRSDAIIDATAKGNISRFINHSCDPNAETQKWTVNGELRIGFFCRRKIYPGEEITFDYQFQRYGKEAQKCFCESTNCRGWIGEEPDSEDEEEDEISSESEEEEQIVPELEKGKAIVEEIGKVEKEVEENIQLQTPPLPVPPPSVVGPLPVPPPIVPMPVPPPIKENDKLQEDSKAAVKPFSVIQEKVLPTARKQKKVKHRNEFRFVKKKSEYLEDPDLEEEIKLLTRTGLKNQVHTLSLSRLMVRAKMLGTRIRLLEILRTGEMPCRRLFLDYHGLRLLHGWMNESEIKDIEKDLEVRLLTVQTLEVLPIPNKTMLKESKVFQTVQSWGKEKEFQSTSPNDDSPTDSGSATPVIIEGQHIKKVEVIPAQASEHANQLRTEITIISNKLLRLWDELPEVFRIPKRERIEQMKEHEREADRQYKALNLVDEENDRLSFKRRSERFGKTNKRTKSKTSANKYKWTRDQGDKDKKEKDKEADRTDIDPNLTKVQRRQLFAAKVAKDEEEKRLAEERREFDIKCKFYGLEPSKVQPKDLPFCVNPASGQWYTADKKTIETPPSHAHIQVPSKPQSTDPKDYNLPSMDLPPLWKFAIDPRGRIYYYHIKIRIPQWEPPIKIEPLTGGTEQIADEPIPSTSKAAYDSSNNPNCDSSSSSDSDESVPESKIRKIVKLLPDDGPINDAEAEAKRERKKERYSLLVQERSISPRREEDRLYNQLEMRRYKENKEKIRKRREEIKRKKAQLPKDGTVKMLAESSRSHDGLPLPIQDYLISSDEEEHLKSDCDSPPLEQFVQGDKIVDELDALKKEKTLKRLLPVKDKPEYKKRQKVEDRKRTEDTKTSQKSTKHSNLKYLARKAKEKFRSDIAGVIVQHLTPYRKDSCQIGRITNIDDFKHLARKLTHFVMIKELKHCDSTGQVLEVTESVKNKSREFIKKYMAKYGEIYIRPKNDPEFKDIPH